MTQQHVLDTLCAVLEDEAERQETVLAVCRAQQQAILVHDAEYMEAKAAALEALIRETASAEAGRLKAVGEACAKYSLPPDGQTLSGLVGATSDPWRARLVGLQTRLQAALRDVRQVVRVNTRLLRQSYQVVEQCLGVLEQYTPATQGRYDARGQDAISVHSGPVLVDRKG